MRLSRREKKRSDEEATASSSAIRVSRPVEPEPPVTEQTAKVLEQSGAYPDVIRLARESAGH
jgi:hypothetical protein